MTTQPSYVRNQGVIHLTYRDGGGYGQFINACRLDAWRAAIERHDLDLSTVVDVGCSLGSWRDNWRELGFRRLIGIEPNAERAAQAEDGFDEVHNGFASDMRDSGLRSAVVGSNGVIVHILEEEEQTRFLADASGLLAPGGFLCASVLNCAYYSSPAGRVPWTGPNSCTRTLERQVELAEAAGLEVVDQIGTFINPWCFPDLDFISGDEEIQADPRLFGGLHSVAQALRCRSLIPFGEVLLVMQRR